MHGAGLAHARVGPRHGLAEVEIHFEDGAAISPACQAPANTAGKLQSRQTQDLPRGQVQNNRLSFGQFPQVANLASGVEAGMMGTEEV